ncbi:recombination regulator RecX, partial [Burkholderia multivorans]
MVGRRGKPAEPDERDTPEAARAGRPAESSGAGRR